MVVRLLWEQDYEGSNPSTRTIYAGVAQSVEHSPFKRRVGSSSLLTSTIFSVLHLGLAELADAQDLKSCESNLVPVRSRHPRPLIT